jgi:hypothetical protein
MSIEQFIKLELKIYSFSINIFSFVKSLSDKKIAGQNEKKLLNSANDLYSIFLDELEHVEKGNEKADFAKCIIRSEECVSLMKNYELSGLHLNEKVDLAIEANEILRSLKLIKTY